MTQGFQTVLKFMNGGLLVWLLAACAQAAPAPVSTTASVLPDLVISNVQIVMQGAPANPSECVPAYAPYILRALVENRGTAQAVNIPIIELSTGHALQIGELPAGQGFEIFIPTGSPDGRYRLSLDPQNQIAEMDETNNIAEYIAITPTPPILCTPAASSQTPAPPALWNTYRNELYGFTFEYPSAYEDPAYKDLCGLQASETGIHLGQRIDLQFLDPGGLGLEVFAGSLVQSKGWSVDSQIRETIGGLGALTIQYRFGGTNRFGSVSLLEHNGRIFGFNFTAGSFCEIPGTAAEPVVYTHLLQTFRFEP